MEDSLAMLDQMEQKGWKELWLTPHIMEEVPNKTEDLRNRFDELQSKYNGSIKLHLGAENMLDELFQQRLAERDLLPLDNNLLLVETSYFDAPRNMDAMLDSIFAAGYTPMLAHPERYNYMTSEEDYHRLLKKGVQFQLNVLSRKGIYGPVVKKKAEALLRANAYTRYGSDLHRPSQLQHFQ